MSGAPAPGALVTATADDLRVGIAVPAVREIVRDRDVTPVPLAGTVVRGLMNLRGDLVTVLDLRARLGRPAHPDPAAGVHVVLRATPLVSLLVDAVGDVVEPDTATVVEPPATVAPDVRRLVPAAVLAADEVLLVLDAARVASLADSLNPPPPAAQEPSP